MRALWGLYRTLNSLGEKIDSEYADLKQVIICLIIFSYVMIVLTNNTVKEIQKLRFILHYDYLCMCMIK